MRESPLCCAHRALVKERSTYVVHCGIFSRADGAYGFIIVWGQPRPMHEVVASFHAHLQMHRVLARPRAKVPARTQSLSLRDCLFAALPSCVPLVVDVCCASRNTL